MGAIGRVKPVRAMGRTLGAASLAVFRVADADDPLTSSRRNNRSAPPGDRAIVAD